MENTQSKHEYLLRNGWTHIHKYGCDYYKKEDSLYSYNYLLQDAINVQKDLDNKYNREHLLANGWFRYLTLDNDIRYNKDGKGCGGYTFEEAVKEQKKDDNMSENHKKLLDAGWKFCEDYKTYSKHPFSNFSLEDAIREQNHQESKDEFANYTPEHDIYSELESLKKENEELKNKLSLYKESLTFITTAYTNFVNKTLEFVVK